MEKHQEAICEVVNEDGNKQGILGKIRTSHKR